MNESDAILYGNGDCTEASAMAEVLKELGVQFEFRCIDRDPTAMREWEQLDGDRAPLLRMGPNTFVRGFDRIKVQQLFGWVGC
jgi:hypothetical protein